ncbi:MAG: hypothetical protein HOV80_19860 [Polyangiaceae bacterium]|nr:hypothetical protein [Polyangiaceae bacterium]
MRRGSASILRAHRARRRAHAALGPDRPLAIALRGFAQHYVTEAIVRHGGDRRRAAVALGISLRTLYRYLAAG